MSVDESQQIPAWAADRMLAKWDYQDMVRGPWRSPRESTHPAPPWPSEHDPALRFLLARATASVEAGMDLGMVLMQLAVHAWFEGGIENYDRGQREARQPPA